MKTTKFYTFTSWSDEDSIASPGPSRSIYLTAKEAIDAAVNQLKHLGHTDANADQFDQADHDYFWNEDTEVPENGLTYMVYPVSLKAPSKD